MSEHGEHDHQHNHLDRPMWGAKAIADHIRRNERQTFYLLENGALDATKVRNVWGLDPTPTEPLGRH